MIDIAEISC